MRLHRVVLVATALTLAWLTAYGVGAPAGLTDRAYVLAMGAVALAALLDAIAGRTTRPEPTAFDRAARPVTGTSERPARLTALEDLAAFGTDRAHGTHTRLRPYLRDLVRDRLAVRGADLDADGAALLGPETWDLVRPDRPAPPDPRGPGLDDATVDAITTTLERLR